MAYKPNSEDMLDTKRLKAISEYENKIDETLKEKRGEDNYSVLVKYSWDHGEYHSGDKWLWEELVQRYKNVGWRFVTVYLSAKPYGFDTAVPNGYDTRTEDLYIYVSLQRPLKNCSSKRSSFGQLFFLRQERYQYVCGDKIE